MSAPWLTPQDEGMCLSMHQPWASLLIYGIKRIEGRSWPTAHRGRLWIAATAKQPTPLEIEEMEATYRAVHAGPAEAPSITFPPSYPTGVLLGCVEVVGCLKAEQVEAWEALPPGLKAEVGSPYCFLCQAAKRLVVPHQIRGWPKLFKLENKMLKAAQLGLKPAPNSQDLSWAVFGDPPAVDAPLPPPQSKNRYKELQARLDATRSSGSGLEQQQPGSADELAHQADGSTSVHSVARTGTCLSPRAAASAASAASAAASSAMAGLPRSVAIQQQQMKQDPADPAKRLRAAQKKLRQIAALEQRRLQGGEEAELLPEEAAKLQQRRQLESEVRQLQAQLQQGKG